MESLLACLTKDTFETDIGKEAETQTLRLIRNLYGGDGGHRGI